MKNNIKYGIFGLCILTLLAGCARKDNNADTLDRIEQRGKIIVGVKSDTKPFGYFNEKKELTGFDIDLAKCIAKKLLGDESKVEFKQVTSSSRILALNSEQVDMVIATMSITQQRKQVIDFSIPYYIAGQAILVPKNSNIRSISDLNGKKVIIIFGSTAENNLRMVAPDADIIGFKTYISGYYALKQGRADAMASDDTILAGFAMSDNSTKLLPQKYTKEPYAIGFRKVEKSIRLKKRINAILEEMRANGELEKLKRKWISF